MSAIQKGEQREVSIHYALRKLLEAAQNAYDAGTRNFCARLCDHDRDIYVCVEIGESKPHAPLASLEGPPSGLVFDEHLKTP